MIAAKPIVPVLEARGLTRAFAGHVAVNCIDLTLGAGECLALFGPNGAGKTTLLRLLAGLLTPTAGSAKISGLPLRADAHARSQIGLISHQSMLYAALTARENVEFAARLYGVRDPRAKAEQALTAMRVEDRSDSPVRSLSRGLQQRVSIARAMVHAPRVVLLDEPYAGLDAAGAAALTAILAHLRQQGGTLIVVTHNMSEGLSLASHAAIMRSGRLVRLDTTTDLDTDAYEVEYRDLAVREYP